MKIEKQSSRIIIRDYDSEEKKKACFGVFRFLNGGTKSDSLFNRDIDKLYQESKLSDKERLEKILSGQDFKFFFEREDEIIFPVGVFDIITKMFPKARVSESKPWDADNLKYVTDPLPNPRNKLQQDAIKFIYANSSYVAATLPPGSGKEEPYSNLIPTPDGIMKMGELNIGDYVFDRRGKPTKILHIFEQGIKDIYEITFEDGRKSKCGLEHLWTVTDINGETKTATVNELLDDYIDKQYFVPNNYCVEYNKKSLPMDPYLLGILLMVGIFDSKYFMINIHDMSLLRTIEKRLNVKLYKFENNLYGLLNDNGLMIQTNELFMESLSGLSNKNNSELFIPLDYLHNSEDNRMELLYGLIEGSRQHGIYDQKIESESLVLLRDIQYLLRGFGYPVYIKSNSLEYDLNHNNIQNHIINIELIGKEQARCIMVDNDEHLYLTQDFIVTHNTFMSSYTATRLNKKTIIFVPTTNLRKQWSESLQGLFKVPSDRIIEVMNKEDLLKDKDWYIMLHQTEMNANKDDDLEEYFKRARIGTKIIDETHMFFKNVLMISCIGNFQNNIHLTATFGRSSDEEDKIFKKAFGPVPKFDYTKKNILGNDLYPQKKHVNLYSINVNSRIPKSILSSMTTFKYGLNVMKYSNILFPDNNNLTIFEKDVLNVISNAVKNITYGKMLFLFPTIKSSEKMGRVIQKMFPDKKIGVLNSSHSKQENEDTLKTADIIVSTSKSSGTGLDIKGLSVVVAAEQYKSPILSEQMFGRLRERPDGKETFYFDITDLSSKQLVNWRNSRMSVMRQRAKSFKIVKGTDVKIIKENVEYLQYLYNEAVDTNDYSDALSYLQELMFYM